MLVSDVYSRICKRFLEPLGLTSGIFTVQDFLSHFADVMEDFLEHTSLLKLIVTEATHFSVGTYETPDQVSHVDSVFVSGRMLRRESLRSLDEGYYQWRKPMGIPMAFHADGIPGKRIELPANATKRIEIYPRPNYEGQAIPTSGPNTFQSPETGEFMIAGDFYPTWRDVTIVGPQVPLNPDWSVKTTWALDDPLPAGLPNSAMPYLAWGCLAAMFSDDSEAKDEQRAKYCESRYQEGVMLFSAIVAEKCLDAPEGAM